MSAETPTRRKRTAKEVAKSLGCSTRTVRRIIAEPRDEWEARARERRARAVELRKSGMKYREIAQELGAPIGTVGRMLNLARQHGEF